MSTFVALCQGSLAYGMLTPSQVAVKLCSRAVPSSVQYRVFDQILASALEEAKAAIAKAKEMA